MSLTLLSIQSHVVYGHVGNSAVAFPLQRLGAEVLPLNTVQFSSHTGYPGWRGRVFDAAAIDDCVAGLAAVGTGLEIAVEDTAHLGSGRPGKVTTHDFYSGLFEFALPMNPRFPEIAAPI